MPTTMAISQLKKLPQPQIGKLICELREEMGERGMQLLEKYQKNAEMIAPGLFYHQMGKN
jgi:hypothetical protein